MPHAFIAVGSNLGDRSANLNRAEGLFAENGICCVKQSSIYETEPVGGPPQGKYLNAVWEVETELLPRRLLETLAAVEKKLGRVREIRNEPRTIDLDILFYEDRVVHEKDLEIPHPRLHERLFVLQPLAEIAPDWVHPVFGKSVRELLQAAGNE